jgi:hypothetical protein
MIMKGVCAYDVDHVNIPKMIDQVYDTFSLNQQRYLDIVDQDHCGLLRFRAIALKMA